MSQKEPTAREAEELKSFHGICKALRNDGFEEIEVDVSTQKLNLMGLFISGLAAAMIYGAYLMTHKSVIWFSKFSRASLLFLIAFVLAIVVHELLHGVVWCLFCKGRWQSIRFKFIWEYLMPCCICLECIPQFGYTMGLITPIIVLGVVPCVASFLLANQNLMLFSLVMIVCGGGDVYFAWKIRKLKNWILLDNPVTRNCMAFKK